MTVSTVRVALLALLASSASSHEVPTAAAGQLPDFAGTNIFTTHGNQYASLHLAQDATMVEASIETDADYAGIYLMGPRTGWRSFRVGHEWFGGRPGPIADPMPAGDYDVYFVSSDAEPMTTRLRFAGIAGQLEMAVVGVVSASIAPLSSTGLDTPWLKVQSFEGTRTTAATTIAGFLMHTSSMFAEDYSFQWQWRSNDKTFDCWAENGDGVGLGTAWTWSSFILPDVPAGRVTLDFYVRAEGGPRDLQVHGLWIERAVAHPALAQPASGPLAPRGLNYDQLCARDRLDHLLQG